MMGRITKRGLLGGLLGLVATPAVVKASSLMPISVWKETPHWAKEIEPGWFLCDGGYLPPDRFAELFAAIGAAHGGDGVTTFAVPELKGFKTWRLGQDIVKIISDGTHGPAGQIKPYVTPIPQPENTWGFSARTADEAKHISGELVKWEKDWASSGRVFWPSPDFLEAHPIWKPWPK